MDVWLSAADKISKDPPWDKV